MADGSIGYEAFLREKIRLAPLSGFECEAREVNPLLKPHQRDIVQWAVRVGSWVKPFCSFKPGVPRAYAWEPVIFRGGRPLGRSDRTVRDYCAAPITLRRGFTGAKPAALLHWICEWLGVQAGDAVDDLFPGSGGCAIAIADYLSAKAGAMPASGLFEASS